MQPKEYIAAAFEGARSFGRAVLEWRRNPFVRDVARRLWGPAAPAGLALLVVVCVGASPFFPGPGTAAALLPPLAFLLWVPGEILEMLWSVPAVFGYLIAWRIRALRGDDSQRWTGAHGTEESNRWIFEAAAVPVAAAGLALAVGLEAIGPAIRIVEGTLEEWPSPGPVLLSISRSLVVMAIVGGVLSVHRSLSKGIGQVLGAAFVIFGLRMAIGFAVPWMTSWWTYLPIPFIEWVSGDRSPGPVLFVFNTAVVAVAWVMTMSRAEDSLFWTPDAEPDTPAPDSPEEQSPTELPPLPTPTGDIDTSARTGGETGRFMIS
jgi:hypothetical protein